MREGHLAQPHESLSAGIDLLGEAVGPADGEDQAALARDHHLLDALGKGAAGELVTALVEEPKAIAWLHLPEQLAPLLHALLRLAEAPASQVGDHLELAGEVMLEPCRVVLHQLLVVLAIGLAYD